MRTLELPLGVALFHRSQAGPARLELTGAARDALGDLQEGFDRLLIAVAKLKARRTRDDHGHGAARACGDWLLKRVGRFETRFPSTTCVSVDMNSRIIDFTTDRGDVGIRYSADCGPGLKATRLLSDDLFPVFVPNVAIMAASCTDFDAKHGFQINDCSTGYNTAIAGGGVAPGRSVLVADALARRRCAAVR